MRIVAMIVMLALVYGCKGILPDRYLVAHQFMDTCQATRHFMQQDYPRASESNPRQLHRYYVCDSTEKLSPSTMKRAFMQLRFGTVPVAPDQFDSLDRIAMREVEQWLSIQRRQAVPGTINSFPLDSCDAILFFSSSYKEFLYAEIFPRKLGVPECDYGFQTGTTICLKFLFRFDNDNRIVEVRHSVAAIE
ncbi:MAG: hypothetical protein JST22_13335 [Bacteroidetes bacterium]|nr:hypothetical protein [Bacteroidota bacterium]